MFILRNEQCINLKFGVKLNKIATKSFRMITKIYHVYFLVIAETMSMTMNVIDVHGCQKPARISFEKIDKDSASEKL